MKNLKNDFLNAFEPENVSVKDLLNGLYNGNKIYFNPDRKAGQKVQSVTFTKDVDGYYVSFSNELLSVEMRKNPENYYTTDEFSSMLNQAGIEKLEVNTRDKHIFGPLSLEECYNLYMASKALSNEPLGLRNNKKPGESGPTL